MLRKLFVRRRLRRCRCRQYRCRNHTLTYQQIQQPVQRGQIIGYVGMSGRSTGPHLHYEVRIRNTPVNPHKYLRETMQQLASETTGSAATGGMH